MWQILSQDNNGVPGCIPLTVTVFTSMAQPDMMSWTVQGANPPLLRNPGYYTVQTTTVTEDICLLPGSFTLRAQDSCGCGWMTEGEPATLEIATALGTQLVYVASSDLFTNPWTTSVYVLFVVPEPSPSPSPSISPPQSPSQSSSPKPAPVPSFSPSQSPFQSPSPRPVPAPSFSPPQSPAQSPPSSPSPSPLLEVVETECQTDFGVGGETIVSLDYTGDMIDFSRCSVFILTNNTVITSVTTITVEFGVKLYVESDVLFVAPAVDIQPKVLIKLRHGVSLTLESCVTCIDSDFDMAPGSVLAFSGPSAALTATEFRDATSETAPKMVTCALGTVISFYDSVNVSTALSFSGNGSLDFMSGSAVHVHAVVDIAAASKFSSCFVNVASNGKLNFGFTNASMTECTADIDTSGSISFTHTMMTFGSNEDSSGSVVKGSGSISFAGGSTLQFLEPVVFSVDLEIENSTIVLPGAVDAPLAANRRAPAKWYTTADTQKTVPPVVQGNAKIKDSKIKGSQNATVILEGEAAKLVIMNTSGTFDLKLSGAQAGKGSRRLSFSMNRRTDLTMFALSTYSGTLQTGKLTLDGTSAVEFNLSSSVGGTRFSNTLGALQYEAGSVVTVIEVTRSSLPTHIGVLQGPTALPLEVVITDLSPTPFTATLIQYGSAGACLQEFSGVVIDNCRTTCRVVGLRLTPSVCSVLLVQTDAQSAGPTDSPPPIAVQPSGLSDGPASPSPTSGGHGGTNNSALAALAALAVIPVLLLAGVGVAFAMYGRGGEEAHFDTILAI